MNKLMLFLLVCIFAFAQLALAQEEKRSPEKSKASKIETSQPTAVKTTVPKPITTLVADCEKYAFCYPPKDLAQYCKTFLYYIYTPNRYGDAGYTGHDLMIKQYMMRLFMLHRCEL